MLSFIYLHVMLLYNYVKIRNKLMGRPGLSYQDIQKAAATLLQRGVNPSIQRIRELLGTGSNSTIGQYLKRWQQEQLDNSLSTPPPAVPEVVTVTLEQCWKVALEQAQAHFQEQREQADRAVKIAEQARDEARLERDQFHREAAERRQDLTELQKIAKELQEQLLVEKERRRIAEETIAVSENRTTQAIHALEQIRDEAACHAAQFEAMLQQVKENAESRLAEAQQQLHYERQRNETNEARLMKINEQNRTEYDAEKQTFMAAKQAWEVNEISLKEHQRTLQDELAVAHSKVNTAEENVNLLRSELHQAQLALKEWQVQHLTTVRTVELLRDELRTANDKYQELQRELKKRRAKLRAKVDPDQ
jgi:hypothetical protein